MKNLYKEVKYMINLGIYSMYSVVDQDWYLLHIPASPPCCSSHPGPAQNYKIDKDGNVVEKLPDDHTYKAAAMYRFTDVEPGEFSKISWKR